MTKSEIIGLAPIGRIQFVAYTNVALLLAILGPLLRAGSIVIGEDHVPIEMLIYVGWTIDYLLICLALILAFKFGIQRFNDLGMKGFPVITYLTPFAPVTYLALAFLPSCVFAKDKTPKSNAPNLALKLLAILPLFVIVPVVSLGVIAFLTY